MTVHDLPTINASLNGLAAVFLAGGFWFIRRGQVRAHRTCMMAALTASAAFLACYLTYHFTVRGVTRFQGTGTVRAVYLAILLTHTVLATVVLPLVLVTVARALRGAFERHRRIARLTWPVWMYVSVTGVLVYLMLYHWFPRG